MRHYNEEEEEEEEEADKDEDEVEVLRNPTANRGSGSRGVGEGGRGAGAGGGAGGVAAGVAGVGGSAAARAPDPQWPTSVPEVLRDERRAVLAGVGLVFSRVFPLGVAPERHPLWRLAGAYTRPLFSSTSAVLVTPPLVPLSNRLGENYAPTKRAYVEPNSGRV